MKTVGIIAEFNPFHNGHKYLIDYAKKISGAGNIIVVCSGNYVQRGIPAFFDKSERTQMALNNGVDAVFELPVFYSTASAELFARASVKFLNDLNCVDYLCFGCETAKPEELALIAATLSEEPEEYKAHLNNYLKSGISFPKARMYALKDYYKDNTLLDEQMINEIAGQPNNILALEYLKALKHFNSSIKPVPVRRIGAGYDSLDLNTEFASATGIRNALINKTNIRSFVPDNCSEIIENALPIIPEDFAAVLGCRLLSGNDFTEYFDVSSDLSNRINHYKYYFTDINSFITGLQSKNYTYAGISRALLHILLDIKKSDVQEFIDNGYFTYARLLGFNKNSHVLSSINSNSNLEIISKLAAYYNQCTGISKKMLDFSLHADELYRMIYMNRYKKIIPNEFERQIIINS